MQDAVVFADLRGDRRSNDGGWHWQDDLQLAIGTEGRFPLLDQQLSRLVAMHLEAESLAASPIS